MEEGWIRGRREALEWRQWWFRRNNGTRGDNGLEETRENLLPRPVFSFFLPAHHHTTTTTTATTTHTIVLPKACHYMRVPGCLTLRRMTLETGFCTPHTTTPLYLPSTPLPSRVASYLQADFNVQRFGGYKLYREHTSRLQLRQREPSRWVMHRRRQFFGSNRHTGSNVIQKFLGG